MKVTDGQLIRADMIGGAFKLRAVDIKRVYERLRKRSYRKIGEPQYIGHEDFWPVYYPDQHEAYVQGVRDALKAITT